MILICMYCRQMLMDFEEEGGDKVIYDCCDECWGKQDILSVEIATGEEDDEEVDDYENN